MLYMLNMWIYGSTTDVQLFANMCPTEKYTLSAIQNYR